MFQKVLQIEESLLPANFEIPRFTNQLMYGNFNKWNHRGQHQYFRLRSEHWHCINKDGESSIQKNKEQSIYSSSVQSDLKICFVYRLQVPSWMYNSLIDEHIFRYVRMFHLIDTRMKHERHGIKHTRWAGEKWTNSICRQYWMPIEFKSLEERTQVLLQIGPSLDNYL